MDVVVLGSVLIDVVINTTSDFKLIDRHLKKYLSIPYGSKIEIINLEMHEGGSAHNVAADLAKFGNKTGIIGKVGDDQFGNRIVRDLKKEGVDVKNLKVVKNGKTGFSLIFLFLGKDKSILTYSGLNLDLEPSNISKRYLKKSKWLVFTSVTSKDSIKFLKGAVDFAKKNDIKILANPSIRMIHSKKKDTFYFIKSSDIAIMNDEEIKALTGIKNIVLSMKKLNKMGARLVVVTLGPKGAIAFDGKKIYRQRGFNIKVIDPTGCGDSFTAGFLHYFLKGKTVPEALKFANANAALELQDIGQMSLPERTVLKFISKH
jgi:ribokinase